MRVLHSLRGRVAAPVLAAWVAGSVYAGVPEDARAEGGQGSIFLGNEAALRAGAVTAMVRDGSAAWYNPAGLAKIADTNLDVSLNLYGVRIRNVTGGHQVVLPGESVNLDLNHVRLYLIPSAVVFSKRFRPGLVGAVSVFVTENDRYNFDAELRGYEAPIFEGGEMWQTDQSLDMQISRQTYMVGPSLGWKVVPGLTMGTSLLGVFRETETAFQLWNHSMQQEVDALGRQGGDLLVQSRLRDRSARLGVMLSFGLQGSPTERLDLGFSVRAPTMTFLHVPKYGFNEAYRLVYPDGTGLQETSAPPSDSGLRGEFNILSNVRIDLGFAYHWDKVSFSGDFNLRPPNPKAFPNPQFKDTSFSVRFGLLAQLGANVTLGTGIYMDRSGADPSQFTEDIDFYGLTLGLRLERRLWRRIMEGPKGWKELAEGEWKSQKEDIYASKVSLSTTLGLRYGLGHGFTTGTVYTTNLLPADIDPANYPTTTVPLSTRVIEVFSHDLTLFLGSQITF